MSTAALLSTVHRLIIIGSGPAAHTAAIYAARAELKPIMFEGFMAGGIAAGGQLTTTSDVENFPGFAKPIAGYELMATMREQAAHCGTEIITETIDRVDFSKRPFKVFAEGSDVPFLCQSVIIATGATARRLHIEGEEEYWGKGISACAVCDGALPIFRNKPIAVLGGGDSACEEANFLTKFASRVFLIMRNDKFRASATMVTRTLKNQKVEVIQGMVPNKACGNGKLLTHLQLVPSDKAQAGTQPRDLPVSGFFYAIGHTPNIAPFVGSGLRFDDNYICAKPGSSETDIPGVFACGDVTDKKYRQAITAAGMGCMAALDCNSWLSENCSE